MNNEKRVCSNCKYFQRYYIISYNYTFKPTPLGDCSNINLRNSLSARHIRKDEGCDLWQPYELQKLKIEYGARQQLQKLYQAIEETIVVLRDAE